MTGKGRSKNKTDQPSSRTAKSRKPPVSAAAKKKLDQEEAQKLLDAELGRAEVENTEVEDADIESGSREKGDSPADGGELVGALAKAQKPATFAIDVSVALAAVKAKRVKTGPGAPPKKSPAKRYTMLINGRDSFPAFQKNVMTALRPVTDKYEVGSLYCDDLELEAKVPKGQPLWSKIPLAIDSEERYKDFKESLFLPNCYYAESKLCI